MVVIPGGSFRMGSPRTSLNATIGRDRSMG